MLGFYSLIQYQPDAHREEGANVGVVLFTPGERALVRMATGYETVKRRFEKPKDMRRFDAAIAALQARIEQDSATWESVDDLRRFSSKEVNSLVLTPPRKSIFESAEKEVQRLYDTRVYLEPRTREALCGEGVAGDQ